MVPTGKGAYVSCISEWELWRVGVKKTQLGWVIPCYCPSLMSYLCVYTGLVTYIQGTKEDMCAGPLLDAIISVTLEPYKS